MKPKVGSLRDQLKNKNKETAKKRKPEVCIHVTTWMSLENLVLNERNQSEVTCMILFI